MFDALGYYKILEISPDADIETIKTSYHNMAKIWHPDSNNSADASEVFRKLAKAYAVLSDDNLRKQYNILSLCCDESNYPEADKFTVVRDGNEDVNLRIVSLFENKAWGKGWQSKKNDKICNYASALKLNRDTAMTNWLQGWWHYKVLLRNAKDIAANFANPISKKESLRMIIINMLAHEQAGSFPKAASCGKLAMNFLDKSGQAVIKKFIEDLNCTETSAPRPWNILKLRLAQLMPAIAIVAIVAIVLFSKFGCGNLLNFSRSEKINYYQSVKFGAKTTAVDDLVVGKVLTIPVDKSDNSKLYHLKRATNIMYGPSDKFDVLKNAKQDDTVRLTGTTPDNVWARVMIDNGEMGFVHLDILEKGLGAEIPFGSKIVE